MAQSFHLRRVSGAVPQVVHLRDGAVLGRGDEGDVVVDEDGVSRRHCRFEVAATGRLRVVDLGSTNGTFVNEQRVAEAILAPGDRLLIGRAAFVVGEGDAAAEAPSVTQPLGSETIEIALAGTAREYRPGGVSGVRLEGHLAALASFAAAVPAAKDEAELFARALAALMPALKLERAAIFVDADAAAPAASRGLPGGYSRTLLERVIARDEAILATAQRVPSEVSGAQSIVSIVGGERATILAAPISCGGAPSGALVAVSSLPAAGAKTTGDPELRLVALVARTLALALLALRSREVLIAENEALRGDRGVGPGSLIGEAENFKAALDLARRAAKSDATVLILGETGSGKELVARAIHEASPRASGPFVAINCGAIPATMVESELFGHEKGSFTGAIERRVGRFELASGGTLFLDEIAELPQDAQVKLLRVLEERKLHRVGGAKEIAIDVRIVAATHRDLDAEIDAGRFREDLSFRVRVVEVKLPPLRERREDIVPLAEHLLARLAVTGRRPLRLSAAAKKALREHAWPGNVRELRNALERAAIVAASEVLDVDDLALAPPAARRGAERDDPLRRLEDVERDHIKRVLDAVEWNKVRAAEVLGIGRTSLYEKIRLYGLSKPER
jgi:two-component system response regulator AtoC